MLMRGEILPIAAVAALYPRTTDRSRARRTARPTLVRGSTGLCGAWATPVIGAGPALVARGRRPGGRRGLVGRGGHHRFTVALGDLAPLGRFCLLGANERLVVLAPNKRLNAIERDVVMDLAGRALHEVRA